MFEIGGFKIGDKLTPEFQNNHCRQEDEGKVEVECKQYLHIGSIKVSALYFFSDSRLATVSLSFNSDAYDNLVKTYIKKFSRLPYSEIEEPIASNLEQKLMNKKVLWNTASGDFILEKYGNNFTYGYAHLDTPEYRLYLEKKKSEIDSDTISDIINSVFN